MREILFRGKRLDNGEWAYGSLHIEWGETRKDGSRNKDYRILGMRGECYYVNPDTAGQYTGLTDKNGKKIFEGDIVREVWGARVLDEHFVVRMDFDRRGWFPFACGDGCGCCERDVWRPERSEVIGNIHDNPDLLKGE